MVVRWGRGDPRKQFWPIIRSKRLDVKCFDSKYCQTPTALLISLYRQFLTNNAEDQLSENIIVQDFFQDESKVRHLKIFFYLWLLKFSDFFSLYESQKMCQVLDRLGPFLTLFLWM